MPAVPVRKSIGTDHLVCLEDGRKVTMLKRYLAPRYSLTPDQYRLRWGLPKDSPMVAPAYAARRSAMAKSSGSAGSPRPRPRRRPPPSRPRRPPSRRAGWAGAGRRPPDAKRTDGGGETPLPPPFR